MYQSQSGCNWYRGNLHTHTTLSDGQKSPEEAVALYKEKGYDFLALTDHWVLSETVETPDFLLLSGIEYDTGKTVRDGITHIVGVGMEEAPALAHTHQPPQQIIDEINRCGGLAFLAHPAWSLNRPDHIEKLNGLAGAEIYNTTSSSPWNARPDSGLLLDEVFSFGKLLPCTAADDAHWYNGDEARSFLMVKAEELTRAAILNALRNGDFYATQGPRLSVSIKNGRVMVSCSPVDEIQFFSDTVYCPDRVTRGRNITCGEYAVKPTDTYVRVEIMDSKGTRAWSSPIPV